MGTRTYSRRRADGTRVPTALGRSTGKFTGGAPTAPTATASDANDSVSTRAGREFRRAGASSRANPFAFIGQGRDGEEQLVEGIHPRYILGAVDETTPAELRRALNGVEVLKDDFFRDDDGRRIGGTDVLDTLFGGAISTTNARRIVDAATKAATVLEPILRNAPSPTRIQVKEQLAELIRQAGLRSHIYDSSVLNPAATPGQAGNFSGEFGEQLGRRAKNVNTNARRIANQISRLLGDPIPASGRLDELPPEGTIGRRMFTQIMANTGAVQYRSAQKLARQQAYQADVAKQYVRGVIAGL